MMTPSGVIITFTPLREHAEPTTRIVRLDSERCRLRIGRSSNKVAKGFTAAVDNAYFQSPVVSRDHAYILLDTNTWDLQLVDQGSTHGTLVNGEALQPTRSVPLVSGSEIVLGGEVIRSEDRLITPYKFRITFECQYAEESNDPTFESEVIERGAIENEASPEAHAAAMPHNETIDLTGDSSLIFGETSRSESVSSTSPMSSARRTYSYGFGSGVSKDSESESDPGSEVNDASPRSDENYGDCPFVDLSSSPDRSKATNAKSASAAPSAESPAGVSESSFRQIESSPDGSIHVASRNDLQIPDTYDENDDDVVVPTDTGTVDITEGLTRIRDPREIGTTALVVLNRKLAPVLKESTPSTETGACESAAMQKLTGNCGKHLFFEAREHDKAICHASKLDRASGHALFSVTNLPHAPLGGAIAKGDHLVSRIIPASSIKRKRAADREVESEEQAQAVEKPRARATSATSSTNSDGCLRPTKRLRTFVSNARASAALKFGSGLIAGGLGTFVLLASTAPDFA